MSATSQKTMAAVVNVLGPSPVGKVSAIGTLAGVANKVVPNAAQLKNLVRFMDKIPTNSKENVKLRNLPNGGVAAQANSPGKTPGWSAVYQKQIDVSGKTVQYTKTTYRPDGSIVHVKDKINGGTFP